MIKDLLGNSMAKICLFNTSAEVVGVVGCGPNLAFQDVWEHQPWWCRSSFFANIAVFNDEAASASHRCGYY